MKTGKIGMDFSCPRLRFRTWSRKTGSAVPSESARPFFTLRLNHQPDASSGGLRFPTTFRDGIHLSIYTAKHHRVSLEFIRSRKCVPVAFTAEGLRGTGPVVLNVAGVTGAAFLGKSMDHLLMCALFFPSYYGATLPVYPPNR